MKTANAIKRLERAGFEVQHYGNFQFHADKDGHRISWFNEGGEVQSLYLRYTQYRDKMEADFYGGIYPVNLTQAISIAESKIKHRRVTQKRQDARDAVAISKMSVGI